MAPDPGIINPVFRSDTRRSSFIPVRGDLPDEVLWHAPLEQIELSFGPLWLALRSDMLIAGNHKEIVAVQAENGALRWKEPVRLTFTFMCNDEGVLVSSFAEWRQYDSSQNVSQSHPERRSRSLELLYGRGSSEKSLYFVSAPDYSLLTTFHFGDQGYWYGYFKTKKPLPRGRKINYWFQFNRHTYGRESPDWYYRAAGRSLGSLYDPAGNIFYIVMPDHIHYFPPEATSEDEVKQFDVPGIETFALDHRGNLLLVVREEKGFLLKQFSGSGQEQWSVPLTGLAPGLMTKSGLTRLPPASSPRGTVYCPEPKGVVAVEEGEVKWRRELSAGTAPMHITVLADNSLLVGSVNMLHAVDTKGTITKSVTLPSVISCRPIMDTQGRVFVGGEDGVRCLQ